MTKAEQADEFIERCNAAFVEIYGLDVDARPDTHFIVHVSDTNEEGKGIDAIGGNGCTVCATEELNVFIIMSGIKHVNQHKMEEPMIMQGVVSKNQMN